ncbi:hypothetical protein CNMCM6106_009620 [Aspergillus hiratsukae]|uniref:F-box domain-containing protein n=1 Tax=Aspergillus hiratsukae TaxID=1194566 RepID=A0A8H6PKR9_9EURO|nr:hypothetical protein CNMCM6106_009620 [Aspergillus hiratsukae]
MTATQHALLLPEIRRSIIEWAGEEPYDYNNNIYDEEEDIHIPCTREYTLLCCALVNKTWYHEAMPALWKDLDQLRYMPNLPYFFRPITPDCLQFYADFVENAFLHAMDENDDNDEILNGMAFPKLRSLHLFVDFGHEYIPRIQGHRIEDLYVDPRHEAYPTTTVSAEAMGAILEQIPLIEAKVVFPDVRNLVFSDLAPVYRGAPQRLAARLPRLETYDYRYLHEVEER